MEKTRADLFDIVNARLNGISLLLQEMDVGAAERLTQMLLKARRVFVTGKGRSGYIGQCLAMRLMQMGLDAHVPGEATCPRIRRGDLMVGISCSGTTMSTVQFARIARESKASVAALTAVPDSPFARNADHVIVVPVTGKDVKKRYRYVLGPHNNTLFEQALLLYFDGLVYSILERKGIPKRRLSDRHANLE
ncbi:MAG: SIS domain-containing protein [Candidatus Brocadiaceae bacterium]|nr:SIS domain-containing protein [Candidatus Brocadiaceae bacterium]